MILILTASVIFTSMAFGFILGSGYERRRERRRRSLKMQRMPLLLRNSINSGLGPQLPMFPIDRVRR